MNTRIVGTFVSIVLSLLVTGSAGALWPEGPSSSLSPVAKVGVAPTQSHLPLVGQIGGWGRVSRCAATMRTSG
jgi:hypothetical protein